MRRSLLLRLLVLSVAVALGAVAATAVLATYSAGEQFQGELESTASLLESDQQIFGELAGYAGMNSDWSGVDNVVREIAGRTGRRVALTTPTGTVIADSAGGAAGLPSMPSATIDATSPTGGIMTYAGAVPLVTRVTGSGGGMVSVHESALGAPLVSHLWRLTAEERDQRWRLARSAVSCLRRNGIQAVALDGLEGAPEVTVATAVNGTDADAVKPIDPQGLLENTPCLPPGLRAPSAAAVKLNQSQVGTAVSCLKDKGLPFQVTADRSGLQMVGPPKQVEGDGAAYAPCLDAARTDALRPYVAPPAKLYLGTDDRFNVFTISGLLRTAATALGVLLIAALVTALAGRRLVRPILALTGAAQRMTAGDRSTRVPVTGNDEVSRLGHAFNAMAESIERNEQQRRVLVSDVAHELRTPLSNIKGYLEAGQDGVVPLDGALVRSLLEEAELLGRLVSDLQELALADAGMLRMHPEERDVADIAQQAVAAHRAQAEAAGVSLVMSASEPAIAMVDPARLRQALGNLVANAIKFTPPGGTVGVSVRSHDGVIELAVADTGQGIAPEHLPRLFDRFYRADPSRSRMTGGSGLGLAITKHLAEAHGGSVSVTSAPDQGSVFTIRLPAM